MTEIKRDKPWRVSGVSGLLWFSWICLLLLTVSSGFPNALAERFELYVPQIADGGGWRTKVTFVAIASSKGKIEFFDDSGGSLILDASVSDLGNIKSNTVDLDLQAAQTKIIQSTGNSKPAVTGFARITYEADSRAISGAVFEFYSGERLVTSAAVNAVPISGSSSFAADIGSEVDIGVAITKSDGFISSQIEALALNTRGALVSRKFLSFNKHIAKFAGELFPDLPPNFKGSIRIGGAQMAAVALTVARDGQNISSIPVTPIPPGKLPILAILGTAVMLIGVAANDIDHTNLELQIQMPTIGTDPTELEPIWATYRVQGDTLFHYAPGVVGTYKFRARAWNGDAPSPFTQSLAVEVK